MNVHRRETLSHEASCHGSSLLARFWREHLHQQGPISIVIINDNHRSRETHQQRKNRTKRYQADSNAQGDDEIQDIEEKDQSVLSLCQQRGKRSNMASKATKRAADLPPKHPNRQSSASSLTDASLTSAPTPTLPPLPPTSAQSVSSTALQAAIPSNQSIEHISNPPKHRLTTLTSISSRWKCKASTSMTGKYHALPQKPKRNISNDGEVLSLASLVLGYTAALQSPKRKI
jgi:hypothetical protein